MFEAECLSGLDCSLSLHRGFIEFEYYCACASEIMLVCDSLRLAPINTVV